MERDIYDYYYFFASSFVYSIFIYIYTYMSIAENFNEKYKIISHPHASHT